MADFSLSIRVWYRQNGRNLPWRNTNNPYFIWLSEVILQQTRVDQGLNYYTKFITNYPTVSDLANATEEQILNDWQGLGYYSRARNLHGTAQHIHQTLKGKFPDNFQDLIKLKGIGPYSAAAISSFAFDEKKAVVDGNVYRVLSRVFNIETPVDSTIGKKEFQDLANELISAEHPAEHNQAIMELGALICTPKAPVCEKCPLNHLCESVRLKNQSERPVKQKTTKTRNRYFHYLVYTWKDQLILKQRTENDIWKNMYEFPLIESSSEETPHELLGADQISRLYKHVLSHQKLFVRFYSFHHQPVDIKEDWKVLSRKDLNDVPVPRLIDRYLEEMI